MTGLESGRLRRILVAAGAAGLVILGGVVISRSNSHPALLHVDTPSSSQRPAAATAKRLDTADFAAAPLVPLSRLSASDAGGRIALPWRPLTVHNAQTHVNVVFASRPSCEHVDGVYVVQTDTSVMINVLATNIANAPNCDVVPHLNRAVITLASPLAARSLVHARLNTIYWPANPFDGT